MGTHGLSFYHPSDPLVAHMGIAWETIWEKFNPYGKTPLFGGKERVS